MAAMTVRVDDKIYEWLRAFSFRTRIPMSKIVGASVLSYLQMFDDQPPAEYVLTSDDTT